MWHAPASHTFCEVRPPNARLQPRRLMIAPAAAGCKRLLGGLFCEKSGFTLHVSVEICGPHRRQRLPPVERLTKAIGKAKQAIGARPSLDSVSRLTRLDRYRLEVPNAKYI